MLLIDYANVPFGHVFEQFQVELSAKYYTVMLGHLYTHSFVVKSRYCFRLHVFTHLNVKRSPHVLYTFVGHYVTQLRDSSSAK